MSGVETFVLINFTLGISVFVGYVGGSWLSDEEVF